MIGNQLYIAGNTGHPAHTQHFGGSQGGRVLQQAAELDSGWQQDMEDVQSTAG